MTPDEKNLISGLFGRLKDAEASAGPKDAEADALIKQLVAQQPSAPYQLVQTVLVQEHALNNAQARIAELEAQVAAPKPSGSFLGGVADKLGPWGRRAGQAAPAGPAPMQQPPQPQAPQPGYAPYASTAAMAPAAGGGFLQSALATAAGVAGGALLFQGISGLLHQNAGAFGPALGTGFGPGGGGAFGPSGGTTVNETVNNYYGNEGSLPADDRQGGYEPAPQDSSYDTADAADYGSDSGDFGGSDDV
jgi:hypothetical protein